ncbi:hypothetical protein HUN88_04085 [Bacillus amyloliquefaciens]|uniref:hypothetical protein n=1 Tax=Bacillus amyloliquefaciens group TaxID=1938374 RepID=UPI0013D2A9BB|nr:MULTISPECIES: hypothetical protein [Bacillus amyloliquefaciens group]NUI58947.1 hypothetical protein [Bacillus amyloliquefaciens]
MDYIGCVISTITSTGEINLNDQVAEVIRETKEDYLKNNEEVTVIPHQITNTQNNKYVIIFHIYK